ncbi:MAG: DNA-3-methyladenine glycosylase [Clostridia bacterium]|nr:DNA-3-methyladenine glycosylase [Clostridia bacterium]
MEGEREGPEAPGPLPEPGFFDRPAVELAPALLGLELVHESPEGLASGLIVEVEAYAGPEDRAAHSWGGRRTARTEVMFGPPGHAYIFSVYGMHWCFNVVAGPGNKPEAVLVRALEPLRGLDLMRRRRRAPLPAASGPAAERALTAGPGRLCQALAITGAQYGLPLWRPESPLRLHRGRAPVPAERIATGVRVGIDYAGEWRLRPWRFWIRDNPYVSGLPTAQKASAGGRAARR